MEFTEVEKINNAAIIKDSNGKFGVQGISIEVYPQWDKYNFIPLENSNRYITIKQNGKYGIYDTVKVDYVSYCTMSRIIRYDPVKKILYGKEPHKFLWVFPVQSTVEIPLF